MTDAPEKQIISKRVITRDHFEQAREDRATAKPLAKDKSSLVLVQEDDPRYQAAIANRKCEHCSHFDNEQALIAMREQNFVERIVNDDKWREEWFNDYEHYGVCTAFSDSGGLRLNDPNSPGICAASDLDSSLPMGSDEGSVMCLCPYYKNRKEDAFAISSRAGVRGPTKRDSEARVYAREHDGRRHRGEKI